VIIGAVILISGWREWIISSVASFFFFLLYLILLSLPPAFLFRQCWCIFFLLTVVVGRMGFLSAGVSGESALFESKSAFRLRRGFGCEASFFFFFFYSPYSFSLTAKLTTRFLSLFLVTDNVLAL